MPSLPISWSLTRPAGCSKRYMTQYFFTLTGVLKMGTPSKDFKKSHNLSVIQIRFILQISAYPGSKLLVGA